MQGSGSENFKEINKMRQQISEAMRRINAASDEQKELAQTVRNLIQVQTNLPPSPAANQLWNGELGHSVNSWHDAAYVTTDKAKECAHFFSHDAPVNGQQLILTDARTNSTNQTLKTRGYGALPAHSTYSNQYSDWEATRGAARLAATKTIDTPLPQNSIEADMTTYVNFIAAKRHQYIEIPETLRLFAGIWDDTAGQRDWLSGSVGLSAAPSASGGTTELRYRLFIETDRGYSILSPEIIVASGFSDAEFAAGKRVNLQWFNAGGYLRVSVLRYKPSTGTYATLAEFSSGASSYIDNNSILRAETGYPTATDTGRKAVFYTTTGNLITLATDGGVWDSIHCIIFIPNNYNKALTTDRQWLRLGLTQACNLFVGGITTNGTTTISHAEDIFEAEYSALYSGLTIEIYDADDVLLATTTVASRTDAKNLVLAASVPAGANRKIRIFAGGFHGILLDKIHLGFQDNVSFAPNALDARALNPVAAPSSGQGGVGTGSTGGSGLCCVRDTPVKIGGAASERVLIQTLELGNFVAGENIAPNHVLQNTLGFERTRLVRTRNGLEKECTNEHRFKMDIWDQTGTPLYLLKTGDRVFTELDDKNEMSEIVSIGALSREKKAVYNPRLGGGCYYIAGRWKPNFWQKILIRLKLMKPKTGGIFAHNNKPVREIEPGVLN